MPVAVAFLGVAFTVGLPLFIGVLNGSRSDRAAGGFPFWLPLLLGLAAAAASIAWPFIAVRFVRFRLTDEVFEMRSGVLTKQHRQVRLDRLQSVNIQRSVGARILGLSAIETSGAGRDSDIRLQFIERDDADRLRAEILRRASGVRAQKRAAQQPAPGAALAQAPMHGAPGALPVPGAPGAVPAPDAFGVPPVSSDAPAPSLPGHPQPPGAPAHPAPRRRSSLSDFVDAAIDDFASTDFGTERDEPSVVSVRAGRYAAATLLSNSGVMLIVGVAFVAIWLIVGMVLANADAADTRLTSGLVALLGGVSTLMVIGTIILATLGSALTMLNYRIAGTPDGVRVTRGVFTQTNDTVAPGRIHSVQVNQSVLWRPFGWYQITVNRADLQVPDPTGSESNEQQQRQFRQILLPVGTRDDVARVLALVLPMHEGSRTLALIESGMGPGAAAEFVSAPRRSWWLKPLSFRRTGYAIDRGVIYLRSGWLMRKLAIIPGERIQGVTISTGPLRRAARVVTISPDTVAGPVTTRLQLVDAETAPEMLLRFEQLAIEAASADTSHRWREAQTRLTVAAARMRAADAQRRGEQPDPLAQQVLRAEHEWQRMRAASGAPAGPGDGPAASGGGPAARNGGPAEPGGGSAAPSEGDPR